MPNIARPGPCSGCRLCRYRRGSAATARRLGSPGEAPKGLSYPGDAEYCAPWTLLGLPALSLPAGFGRNGLPLGIQVVGPYREDYRTLRVAKWVETTLAFAPGLATGLAD